MALYVKAPLKHAQKVKEFLIKESLFDKNYTFIKRDDSILFPITDKSTLKKKFKFVDFEEVSTQKKAFVNTNLKDALSESLTKKDMEDLKTSFDIVGSIAILEIPEELEKKEKLVAETLLKLQKNIKTVVKKAGIHGTEFRTQPMEYLAGVDTKETVHIEHGVRIKLDIEQVYFSPRLSTERLRVAEQVRPGESVLVMFSGCGVYPLVLAKKSKARYIHGIELNPIAHKYALDNVKLNKVSNVQLLQGDVKDLIPKLNKTFDRVLMPLPKNAEDFLGSAIKVCKNGTIIHLYQFLDENEFEKGKNKIKEFFKDNGMNIQIMNLVKCGQHAPRVFRVCLDLRVIKM